MSDFVDQHVRQHGRASRVVYEDPSTAPQESLHCQRLEDRCQGNIIIHTHEELVRAFHRDVDSLKTNSNEENYRTLALWSCVIGYCEALATHKDATRRYAMFPISLDPLRHLIDEDFVPLIQKAQIDASNAKDIKSNKEGSESVHRRTVRAVANVIWKRAQNKKNSSMQDELHANSIYSFLCGDIDGKSLDCFGAALVVVLGMNILGFSNSCLTLSEDHAYESHLEVDDNGSIDQQSPSKRATCEVAIPGNTKAAQSKRGKEISFTFEQLKRPHITSESSWLYMAKNPVLCTTPGMVLAAMVSNLNCDIDKQKPGADGGKPQIVSRPLYRMKRDMLWILHSEYMTRFPFALMELGECEEHLSSPRGMEWVDASDLLKSEGTLVLRNERLFLDAISISKSLYGDAQVYPYLYAGHYHRDAGREDKSQEYRLVEALRLYAEATRVASAYRYDSKDCLQLMKHFTAVASLISKDILLLEKNCGGNEKDARQWQHDENAIAAATWLFGFFDSLLFWEERDQSSFVEVLGIQHKHCLSKLFQHFSEDIRVKAIAKIHTQENISQSNALAVTEEKLIYFSSPRSRRLSKESLLVVALSKGKVVVRELEMAIPSNGEGRSTRQRKRARM